MEKQRKVKTTSAPELRQLEQTAISISSYRLNENPNVAGRNFWILYLGTRAVFFFPFKWSRLRNYLHFERAYHHSTQVLYRKAVWHDRDLSLKNQLGSCCLFLISGVSTDRGWRKGNRWTPEKYHLVFRQGLDQRQKEHRETQLPMKSK